MLSSCNLAAKYVSGISMEGTGFEAQGSWD